MNEDIVVPFIVFASITVMAIGIPLVRAYAKRMELQAKQPAPALGSGADARLERIEQAIEAMAVEVERISEGQRFTTKLLAENRGKALPESVPSPVSDRSREPA